jgi:hypothetical protein
VRFLNKHGYLIIGGESLKKLEDNVNLHLQKGWAVKGPPFKDGPVWRQCLVR